MPEIEVAGAIREILKGNAKPVVHDGALVGVIMDVQPITGRLIDPSEREGAQEPCEPSESQWFVQVIFAPVGPIPGDCDYHYEYYRDEPGDTEIASLVPDGYELLESKIRRTAGHPDGADSEEAD